MVTDLQLEKLRDVKRRELEQLNINRASATAKRSLGVQKNTWIDYKQGITDFKNTFFPDIKREDFPAFHDPSGDITAVSGTLGDDQPGFSQFKWLVEKRLGVCNNVASKPAEDAVRNKFRLVKYSGEVDDKLTEEIMDWLEDPELKFWDQLCLALYYERIYGISVLVKYYTKNDKERGNLRTKAPLNTKPISFQAFPPNIITPQNTNKSVWLGSDPREWDWQGGLIGPTKIHRSRVQTFMTRPSSFRWWGQSIFEAIWIPLLLYFQVFVYMLRHFTKWGGVIPAYMIEGEDDLDTIWTLYGDLFEEMKMNGIFLGRKGDELTFTPSNTAQGLTELMEILKEEIAARTRIPVIVIFGRTSNAGLGSAGYLLAQMEYWGEVANIQRSISDDVMRILKLAGFNLKRRRLEWMLSMNKTDQQRLIDEGMEIENEIMKEQYMQAQIQTMMLLEQAKNPQVDENPMDNSGNKPKNEGEVSKAKVELEISAKEKKVKPSEKDFVNTEYEKLKARNQDFYEKVHAQRKQRIKEYQKQLEGKANV